MGTIKRRFLQLFDAVRAVGRLVSVLLFLDKHWWGSALITALSAAAVFFNNLPVEDRIAVCLSVVAVVALLVGLVVKVARKVENHLRPYLIKPHVSDEAVSSLSRTACLKVENTKGESLRNCQGKLLAVHWPTGDGEERVTDIPEINLRWSPRHGGSDTPYYTIPPGGHADLEVVYQSITDVLLEAEYYLQFVAYNIEPAGGVQAPYSTQHHLDYIVTIQLSAENAEPVISRYYLDARDGMVFREFSESEPNT